MDVQQVQAHVPAHVHHLAGQSDGVGRVLEERVAVDADLVEVEPLGDVLQPQRQVVGDEVELIVKVELDKKA